MIVVAVAVLGSLTVLPAILSKLGDNVDRLRVPFVHRLRRDDGEGRVWGAIVDRVLRRPLLSVGLSGGLLLAIAAPALTLHTAEPGIDTYPQSTRRAEDVQPAAGGVPGHRDPGERRRQGRRRQLGRGRRRRSPSSSSGAARHRADAPADHRRRQPGRDRREHRDPDRRQGERRPVERRARSAAGRDRPGDRRLRRRRRDRRRRLRRRVEGLQRRDEVGRAVRVRLRARLRLPAPAVRLPLARDRGQGDRPQPALRGRRLRHPRARLPARVGEAAARLRGDRRHRPDPSDLPVRDPVRAVDGLPRLHPQPNPGGLRPRARPRTRRSRTGSRRPPA